MSENPDWIWHNGQAIPWADATIHVMAHGLHYGSSVFEGIRCYETDNGPAIFRLDDHLKRLFDSCKMYRLEMPFDYATMRKACCEIISRNEFKSAYIRPIVYRDAANLGISAAPDHPVGVSIMAFEWAPLHGADALEKGCALCVSSWRRISSATNPVMSKAGGHYLTSQLISLEAKQNGFDDGLAVNETGVLVEGAGTNVFLLHKGRLLTPGLGLSILDGITRDTVFEIAKRLDIPVVETNIPRESMYRVDEAFMVGTAAEITPICSLDRIDIGSGKPGPVTRKIQAEFRNVVTGAAQYNSDWLAMVADEKAANKESVNA